MTSAPISQIASYHAHVYFRDETERAAAAWLREQIAARFPVQLGRWHEQPVGPHQHPMYQVAFNPDVFAELVPWLMLNRQDLAILLHPNTANARRDHLRNPIWFARFSPSSGPSNCPNSTTPKR